MLTNLLVAIDVDSPVETLLLSGPTNPDFVPVNQIVSEALGQTGR